MKEEKTYMFQYAFSNGKIKENTDLITLGEAEGLWDKYQKDIREFWDEYYRPQMCIWSECENNTDYGKVLKEIDYRDCELKDGRFYRITRELIS